MNKKPQTSMNVALAIILIICLWVGWSEYLFIEFETSKEEVRNEIRDSIGYYIRYWIQVIIKFLVPIAIIGHFISQLKNSFKN